MTGLSATPDPSVATRGDENAALGTGIRRERVRQSLTLAQLADRAGLSASALSQIERGVTDPSISSLRRISSALGVPFFQFLVHSESPDPVVRRADRRTIVFPGRALQYQLLTPSPQGAFEVLSLELAPGAASGPAATGHDSDECLVVLTGAVDVELAGRWYHLEAGDAMTIQRNLPHRVCNQQSTSTEVLSIISPPDTF